MIPIWKKQYVVQGGICWVSIIYAHEGMVIRLMMKDYILSLRRSTVSWKNDHNLI